MPQRNVATNFTFEQQRVEINELAADFWTQKGTVDTAAPTYLLRDGTNTFTGASLAVPAAFTINSNSGAGTVTIAGNLQVDGTTTTLNSTTLEIADKNLIIAKGGANDAAVDGAGITIDSATDITWNFVDADDAWVSSIGVKAIGGFTGNLTGSATKVNITDHTNTSEENHIVFIEDAQGAGSRGLESDSTLTYNPSTRNLSADNLTTTSLDVDSNDGTDNHTIANFNGLITGGNMAGFKIQYFGCGSDDARAGLYWQHENVGNFRMWMDNAGILRQKSSNPTSHTDGEPYVRLGTTNSGTLNLDGNNANTGDFQGYDALRIHNANGSTLGLSADMYFTVGTGTTNRGAAIGAKYSNPGPGNALYFATNESAITNADTLVERMRITPDGKVLIGTQTSNTSDRFTIVDPGNAFLSLRSDQQADGNSQVIDFAVGTGNRASGNLVSTITSAIPNGATAGGTLKGYLAFSTNSGDSLTERMRINEDGHIFIKHSTTNAKIVLSRNVSVTTDDTSVGVLDFANNVAHTVNARIMGKTSGTGNVGGQIVVETRDESNSVLAERLRIKSNGDVLPGADNTQDLGSSAKRWANVYTGDMHLNNMNSGGNEIDGSEGHWTMQEGSDDLFLINRNTGKKYKFNLTEVS